MQIELIYDGDCPNVDAAREALHEALKALQMPLEWKEHLSDAADLPAHARGWGSPTILVEGDDVGGATPGTARCCRVYRDEDGGRIGAPTARAIRRALRGGSLEGGLPP